MKQRFIGVMSILTVPLALSAGLIWGLTPDALNDTYEFVGNPPAMATCRQGSRGTDVSAAAAADRCDRHSD